MNIISKRKKHFLHALHDEVSQLRKEIASLAKKSGHRLEKSILAERANRRWQSSRDFMRDHATSAARTARQHPAAGISFGSLLILGAIGFGIYCATKHHEETQISPEEGAFDPEI